MKLLNYISNRRVCWASTNGAENRGARPLLALALRDKGEPDFFVRGDFFCFSFVWQTKEKGMVVRGTGLAW